MSSPARWESGFSTTKTVGRISRLRTIAGIVGRRIVLPKLIFVRHLEIAAFRYLNFGKFEWAVSYLDGASERFQSLLRGALVKYVRAIGSGRHFGDLEAAVFCRRCEIRRFQDYDYGTHGGMDIAKYPHHTFAAETLRSGGARRVQNQIEDLPVVIGKGIMEDGIVIGEI